LEIAYIEEEVVWIDNGLGSWRRGGWSVADRRLVKLIDSQLLVWPVDYANMLPVGLKELFTSHDLVRELKIRKSLASKMIYSLRAMDLIELVGKSGRYNLYAKR
jgi:hypothetical protein